jgi:hypothetical protein
MTVEEEMIICKDAHLRKIADDPVNIARRALESLEIKPLPDPKTERIIEELKSMPKAPHDDVQDAAALAPPPTTGILGVDFARFEQRVDRNRRYLNPEVAKQAYYDALQKVQATGHPVFIPGSPFVSIEERCMFNAEKENPHVDIPREPDIFKPTKSMLDILSERIDSDMNKRLTEFGETNGFPVVFVFYQAIKNENGASKATCDIKMYKSDEKQDARLFALKHAGEFGIFDPRSKDEIIKDLEKKIKGLEKDRDYWRRKAEGDDDDTLGIFKHWDD